MILSLAHAPVGEATDHNLYGAWSDIVVGDRPAGLVDCYLLYGDGLVQVAAVWESDDAHEAALGDEKNHPAYALFEAAGLDPVHRVFEVVGRL